MTFSVPIPGATLAAVAAGLAALAVVGYILRMRRRRFEVPFSTLWQRVLRDRQSTAWWQQLRRLLSLLLLLVMLGLLILAVTDPTLGEPGKDARNIVIVVDTSASMKTVDESYEDSEASIADEMTDDEVTSTLTRLATSNSATERVRARAQDLLASRERVGLDLRAARAIVNYYYTGSDVGAAGDDRRRTRLSVAKREAMRILDSMGGSDAAMLMAMDGQATPLSRFTADKPLLKAAVRKITASDTPADLKRALSAAADALRGRDKPMLILIGDGAYPREATRGIAWERPYDYDDKVSESQTAPDAGSVDTQPTNDDPKTVDNATADRQLQVDLSKINVRFVSVGSSGNNVGIGGFNVRRYITNKLSYEVYLDVQNHGSEAQTRTLTLYAGGLPVDVKTITLAPGERKQEIYKNLGGGDDRHLRAVLTPADNAEQTRDIFPLDDEAYALLPTRKRHKVLLVTKDNLYLEGAVLIYDNVEVDKITPDEYQDYLSSGRLKEYHALVLDNFTPENVPPQANVLYFNPSGPHNPFVSKRALHNPLITSINNKHPVMRWVRLADVHFDKTQLMRADPAKGETALARSAGSPVIVAKKQGRRKMVGFGFGLAGTDLVVRVAFPLLLVNTLDWFSGDNSDLITTYATGRIFRVPMDGTFQADQIDVQTPDGRKTKAPLVEGHATFYGRNIGIHRLSASQGDQVVASVDLAANLSNPQESQIAPSSQLTLSGFAVAPPESFEFSPRQTLWWYMAVIVLALLMIEWLTYHRRITV